MAAKLPSTPFYCPPGRLVMGSTHELWTKDQQGRDREKPGLFFGVAVPKSDARCDELLALFTTVAWQHYQHMPAQAEQVRMGLKATNFAWKVEDGDDKKNVNREGFRGCWVFRFATSIIPLKCGDNNTPPNPIDPALIECGYYVDVSGSVAPNGLTDKNAGIYLNPNGVRLLGYGPIILQGQSVSQMFADKPAVLPPGASALPVPTGGTAPMTPPSAPPPALGGTIAPPPPAPVAPPVTALTPEQESAAIAAAAGVTHYPGHRLKADRSGYDPDPMPAPASAPAAPAPAPASPVAPAPLAPPSPATVAPSSPPALPHPGFLTPNAQRTVAEIRAESAAMSAAIGWPVQDGWRPNAARNGWEADPLV